MSVKFKKGTVIDEKKCKTKFNQSTAKKGLTQVDIANELGITVRQFNRLEAGTSNGSVKVWQHLKELLGAKSIDYLLEQIE